MVTPKESQVEKFVKEMSALIRARYALIQLQTFEESRALTLLGDLCQKRGSRLYVWSRTEGVREGAQAVSDAKDPLAVLKWYEAASEKSVLVLKDFHPYLKEPSLVRKLRDLGQDFKSSPRNIVFLSSCMQLPPEMAKEVTVVELPLPSRDEIESLVKRAAVVVPGAEDLSAKALEGLVDASSGLTYDEIENVLARSIVSEGRLDHRLVQEEKRQIVKKSGLLEFLNTHTGDVANMGGLHSLRDWLYTRRKGMSAEARKLNLPLPKGILLVGIPGCGKSLTAMTVGREWELPLLRLDMGKIFSGLVGSSESNIRNAIATCEAVSPCVLWIDEIEKGLSGTQSSGGSDGGTTSRVFGTILTWMQEKKSPVFVLATANDISQLPPEFLRKGRFDEIFFVDLPSETERREIFEIQMGRFGWVASDYDVEPLVSASEGFSGAEIEQTLIAARYDAFGSESEFSQAHILKAINETVPLSKTMSDRLEALRSWAKHRARSASSRPVAHLKDAFSQRTASLELHPEPKKREPQKEGGLC
ncbi:MAG: AAA family ATPase [Bdellovibrionales bacterium]|nr:AAA family ATPase [Bdellovibrionales bacterium]